MTTLRILIWFAIAAAAMLGAVWLAERPGTLTAEWQGWRLDTNVGVRADRRRRADPASASRRGCSIAGSSGAPVALLEGWGESRRQRGYRELTQGLAAVAAGDGVEAQKHARKAEQLLAEPALTLLLSAQAAQLNGDRDGARRAFDAMLKDEQMAFLGLRGLIGQSLRDGDQTKALGYAERAFALRPQTPWVVHSLFDMQAQTGQWKAAQETLDAGMRRKVVDRRQGPRAEGAAAGRAQPRGRARRQRDSDAQALAREAFAPGAGAHRRRPSRLAELQIKAGDAKRAIKTLERGWAVAPHPDLAELYLKASGESDPLKRIGVVRRLVAQQARRHRKPSGARPRPRSTPACGARRGGSSRRRAAPRRRSASAA